MPVLPYYAEAYGADGTALGLLFSVHAAAQFVCAPLWGRLSDRIGRRPVLLFTVAGTAVSLLLLGLAPSLGWMFAARTLSGAFAANVSVASAYIGDVTDEASRTRWMGMLGASFGIGFVLGPALGGLLVPYGYAVPVLAAAGLAALNLVHAALALREPEGQASPTGAGGGGRLEGLRDPAVRRLCLANWLFSMAVTQLETVFALFMMDRFDYDARHFAFLLVAMAVVMGGIQGGGMKALSARFRERSLVAGGALLLAVSFAAIPQIPSVAPLVAVLMVSAVGRAVLQPPLMGLASIAAGAGARGAVMGAFQSSASLARVMGPALAGVLYDRSLAAPFLLAAVLTLAVALFARALPVRRESVPAESVPPDGRTRAPAG